EPISRHANFFMLGGHSLLVTKLLKYINATFNTRLNLQDMMTCPTLLDQAELIETHQWLHRKAVSASNNVEVLTL
ncbi:acyl carrier protein, partial [Rheinheimera gaetbuli]